MAEHALTILFQGDSITDGGRGRTADPNHVLGHSYAFSIGSRLTADFPVLARTAGVYARLFPQLAELRILRHWAGLIHATPD